MHLTQTVKFYERCHNDPITLRVYVFLLLLLSMCVRLALRRVPSGSRG